MMSGPDGWFLTPEGAAARPRERLAVIADVHLGYEWARGSGGDMIPPHSLEETLARLGRLLARLPIERLVVAGDLVESRRPCRGTEGDQERLVRWLGERGVTMTRLGGNHDPDRPRLPMSEEVEGWTIHHGHLDVDAKRMVIGHHHPALKAGGQVAPCFLVSERLIVLPAFSMNAAGIDCTRLTLEAGWLEPSPRVIVGRGEVLLDFGTIDELRRALAGRA